MFGADVYVERRSQLKEQVQSGLILFLGVEFRQIYLLACKSLASG